MKTARTMLCALATSGLIAAPALADGVKIGLIYNLSGPAAALGEQARDGFLLGVDQLGGTLGGLEAEIVIVDDEQQPDLAVSRVRELVEREDVDFVVGPIFSNILNAIHRPVVDAGKFLISSNAGSSILAGEECHPNFFATSYQNDQSHEVMGAYAEQEGFETVFLMAPNYQAGQDSLAGFKRHYTGTVVSEIYTTLGQLDFSGELAQIAALQPAAVFAFMPGGMGVNLVRQYEQAGLKEIPFLSAFTVDETNLPAQGEAALGMFSGANWAPDFDNDRSREFVAAFEERFGIVPAVYAMYGYDTAMLIDSAIAKVEGELSDQDALREALREADFESLRGEFAFGHNHFPIQDFYLAQVVQRDDGQFMTSIVERIFDDYQDTYSEQCEMD